MRLRPCMLQGPCLCVVLLLPFLSSFVAGLPVRREKPSQPRLLQRALSANQGVAPPYDFNGGVVPPRGYFKPESSPRQWPREQQKWRRRLLSPSKQFAADLAKLSKDDADGGNATNATDSWLWGNLTEFSLPDTSNYLSDLCNGTNMSEGNVLPGDAATMLLNGTAVLAEWKEASNTTCAEIIEGKEYNDTVEALKECGSECDGVVDDGCSWKKFRLCAMGSFRKQAEGGTGTCVRNKPLDYTDPKDLPRPPQQLGFWRDFCKYRLKGRKIRIMFEGKNCAEEAVKALTDATNPVECAEAAAKDAECSKVFDFRFGPPAVCRCLRKDHESGCAPAIAEGGHVYGPSL